MRDRGLRLVPDNCEHLRNPPRNWSATFGGRPRLRVIATRREPLYTEGENVVPFNPLELPTPHSHEPLAQLRQNEAVMLLNKLGFNSRAPISAWVSTRAVISR